MRHKRTVNGLNHAADFYSQLLTSLIYYQNAEYIVEIGVAYGDTTVKLCEGATKTGGTVFGFDIWDAHYQQYGGHHRMGSKEEVTNRLNSHGFTNFELTQIDTFTDEFRVELARLCPRIDICLIDGLHTYDHVAHDFFSVYPLLAAEGIVIFDDSAFLADVKQFTLDLRTTYYDGTFDVIDLPLKYHDGHHYGQSILVKRSRQSYPAGYGWQVTPSSANEAEQAWLSYEKTRSEQFKTDDS